jgi:hypothetical protein
MPNYEELDGEDLHWLWRWFEKKRKDEIDCAQVASPAT